MLFHRKPKEAVSSFSIREALFKSVWNISKAHSVGSTENVDPRPLQKTPQKTPVRFSRSEIPDKDLATLALAYAASSSEDLKKAAVIISRFRELDITGDATHNERIIRYTWKIFIFLAEEQSETKIQLFLNLLEEFTVTTSQTERVRVNQALAELGLELQDRFPDIPLDAQSASPSQVWTICDSAMAHSITILELLDGLADLAPIPALKYAVGAVIGLINVVKEFRSTYAPLDSLTNIAAKFILLVAEEMSGHKTFAPSFQTRLDAFTRSLEAIIAKCQAIQSQSLTKKMFLQHADRDAIGGALDDLKHAMDTLSLAIEIQQKADLEHIVRDLDIANRNVKELLSITGAVLLNALQLSSSTESLLPDDSYFPNSRDNDIDSMRNWLSRPDKRLAWLHGPAAMGKSTLVRHLVDVFENEGRLGTYFFFKPNSDIDFLSVFKRMAYEMALLHPSIRPAIAKTTPLPHNRSLKEHFVHLVLEPLRSIACDTNILIVLDAIDQHNRFHSLLNVFRDLCSSDSFPPNVKLLFTCRPNGDINAWAQSVIDVETYALLGFNNKVMKEYMMMHLRQVSDWIDPPSEEQISKLVDLADGHIGWAFYALSLISDRRQIPDDMLSNVLGKSPVEKLDALYHETLKPLLNENRDRSRKVLGMLLVIEEPLSVEDLNRLTSMERLKAEEVCQRLRLLQTRGIMELTPLSHHFHASFLEFLQDPQRCDPGYLPTSPAEANYHLFKCCAKLVGKSAPSNSSSSARYASDFWAHHASRAGATDLLAEIRIFISKYGSTWIDAQLTKFQSAAVCPVEGDPVNQLHWFTMEASYSKWWTNVESPVPVLAGLLSVQEIVIRLSEGSEPTVAIKHLDTLSQLSKAMYKCTWRLPNLDKSIQCHQQALELCQQSGSDPTDFVLSLCSDLGARFDESGDPSDLNNAIAFGREGLELCASSHPDHKTSISILANALQSRFELQGNEQDLEEAITLHGQALALHASADPDRVIPLHNLAISILSRYDLHGNQEDLDQAIELHKEALELLPSPHRLRDTVVGGLATTLQCRFERSGNPQDLDQSVTLHREALALRPEHPSRHIVLNNLANALHKLFETRGDKLAFDEAIVLHGEVLKLRPAPHPLRTSALNNLALMLESRFEIGGEKQDLVEAIDSFREALALSGPDNPHRALYISNLASALRVRSSHAGDLQGLEQAITLHREALAIRKGTHPLRYHSLGNLANVLLDRYELEDDPEDLNESISYQQEVVNLLAVTSPDRAKALNNLANGLIYRFDLQHDEQDLEKAILFLREALAVRSGSHPDRAMSLNNLGSVLQTWFEIKGEAKDLEEAIMLFREAVALCPSQHQSRSMSLSNLANALKSRYEHKLADKAELQEAISLLQESLSLISQDSPNWQIRTDRLEQCLELLETAA